MAAILSGAPNQLVISFDPSEQNQAVLKWTSMVVRYIRNSSLQFTLGKTGSVSRPGRIELKLSSSIKSKTKMDYGVVDRVTISFERHAVFLHKGVGRGYKIMGGMVVRTSKSITTKRRVPVDWFNPILAQTLPELADKIAEANADAVLNATHIMIR
jgi:hypothetical protein